jgi:putative IMPACT (imprinted ancient) family translation regulator
MIIVADKSRREEFENKIKYSSFKEIQQRLRFLDYEGLSKQYESLAEQQHFELVL